MTIRLALSLLLVVPFLALWYIGYRLLVCGAYAWHWVRLKVFLLIK